MTKARFEEIMTTLQDCGDITVDVREDCVRVTFEDFEGFDDDWSEVDREMVEPALVEELEEFFEDELDGDFYLYGELFGVDYKVGYASFDI